MANQPVNSPSEPRNLLRFWVCVVVGVALWFTPAPDGLNPQAWHVFAVFAATIAGLLLRPLPMGACVLLGVLVLGTTGVLGDSQTEKQRQNQEILEAVSQLPVPANTIPPDEVAARLEVWDVDSSQSRGDRIKESFKNSLAGFGDTTVWLVVAAFLVSGAMIHSGLGRRLALMMVAALGQTTLGLGYAIAGAELLLGPFIPSNTARGGGIMMPIVRSICSVLGSEPDGDAATGPKRAGEYLVLCGAHMNLVAAAMYMTGMAANPLVTTAAKDFLDVDFGWGRWLLGAIVPGLVSVALVPLALYWLAPPTLTNAREARQAIRGELKELGPWTSQQITMAIVLLTMLLLWATGPLQAAYLDIKLPTTLVALAGVVALVVLGVLPYGKVTGNAAAWDALLWLGGLVTMAGALKTTGFVDWFALQVQANMGSTTGITAAIVLAVIYFYSMYAFSMMTGHIIAFAGVFFTVAAAVGAPPLVMVALVAYFSNLCGCTTNYSTGPVVIYFGLGYVSSARWFYVGFLISLLHLTVWLSVGLAWWKLLGWW